MEAHEPSPSAEVVDNGLFPFSRIREGQRQFLEDARACVSNRVHLLAHAPTGLGKTAVALAASLECTLDDGITLFLTARQSQHNAALDTARIIWRRRRLRVLDIISREDSCLCRRAGERPPCADSQDCYFLNDERIAAASQRLLDYPLHVTEAQRLCLRMGACPYLAAKKALPQADLVVADFNQVFSLDCDLLGVAGRPVDRTVLVIDEAHNLPGRIMENRSACLQRGVVNAALRSTGNKTFKAGIRALLDYMDHCCFERPRVLEPDELDEGLRVACGMGSSDLYQQMVEYYRSRMRRNVRETAEFLGSWGRDDGMSVRFADPATGTLHVRFLEPGSISAPLLEQCRCAIFMSGTLHPPEMFADLLGIREMAVCRRYPSPFPQENRSVLLDETVSSRYEKRNDGTYEAMADRLATICENVHGNVVAFFPSYDFLSRSESCLSSRILGKRIVTERRGMAKAERDSVLLSLRGERPSLLLATISGSFAEGVDFRDNLLSCVVVVGLPLAPPSLDSDEMFKRLEQRHGGRKAMMYVRIYPAVTRVLQAAGRAIRSETDRATIVLLDDRYRSDVVRAALPSDFRPRPCGDLASALQDFHGPRGNETAGPSESVTGKIIS